MSSKADFIIVGLGASGSILARELASSGARVIAIDKGPYYSQEDFRFKQDEIRYWSRHELIPDMKSDPITWRPDEMTEAVLLPWATGPLATHEPLHLPPSIGTGGGTVHWSGSAWRLRQSDFRMRSTILERFGKEAIPEHTSIVDWPISYSNLEPYYDRVEWEFGFSGKAGNIKGEIVPGGNPFEAPRSRDYPLPPLTAGAADRHFVEACEKLGFHPFPQATAIASEDYGGRSGCVYCGFCHGFPCHVNAKTNHRYDLIPEAVATGNLEIRPFSRVLRVIRRNSRVQGVEYMDAAGELRTCEADNVILAAYALENARLLLVSGINESGVTGKYLTTHNFGWFTGLLPEFTNPFMGPLNASSVIDDFNGELVPDNEDGVIWGSAITSFTGDVPPLKAAHGLPPDLPRWGAPLKEWMRENYRRLHSIYAQVSNFPDERFYVDLDPRVKDRFGQPALRMTHSWVEHDIKATEMLIAVKARIAEEMGMTDWWVDSSNPDYHLSTHEHGTHRMGDDPSASVVDQFGRVHECEGLYAIGGGQFPTCFGYNPTITIMALAFMAADKLCGGLTPMPAYAEERAALLTAIGKEPAGSS